MPILFVEIRGFMADNKARKGTSYMRGFPGFSVSSGCLKQLCVAPFWGTVPYSTNFKLKRINDTSDQQ